LLTRIWLSFLSHSSRDMVFFEVMVKTVCVCVVQNPFQTEEKEKRKKGRKKKEKRKRRRKNGQVFGFTQRSMGPTRAER